MTLKSKCLLFAGNQVLLSPTKEGKQQHPDLLHSLSQTWALTVNVSKTKIMLFKKRPSLHKYKFHLDTVALEQTKNHSSLNTTGNFNKAVNDLRDKARTSIHLEIPIKIWHKFFDEFFVIEPMSIHDSEIWGPAANQDLIKRDKHQIETLHAEFCNTK